MKIDLPKDMRSFAFSPMTIVELNDTVVERMMSHIFEMAIKNGRTASTIKNAEKYAEALSATAHHPKVSGFDSEYDRAVLDGLIRSTVVVMGRQGLTRKVEQMQYLYPTTVAVYRAGFPNRGRHRQADALIYREMLAAIEERPKSDERSAKLQLSDLFRSCFGAGVTIDVAPKWEPRYDGSSAVDVSSLLSLYFLEHFEPKSSSTKDLQISTSSPVPAATRPLGREVVSFLETFGQRLPARSMTDSLTAIIGLRLFQLPLRTGRGVRQLMDTGSLPADMADDPSPNPLEQYVDFTGVPDSPSARMAQACVQRDISILTRSFGDRLVLKWVAEAADALGIAVGGEPGSGEWLESLVALKDDPRVDPYLSMLLLQITRENAETEDRDAAEFLAAVGRSSAPAYLRLSQVLTEALRKRGFENALKWFWSTGGILTDIGVLSGTLKLRQSWTYAPKDGLLSALLASLFIAPGRSNALRSLPFEKVLSQLEDRFGLLIARPPAGMGGAENRAAVEENLAAFKRRLQLLGVFDGLSDDFSAQRVRNPMAESGDLA